MKAILLSYPVAVEIEDVRKLVMVVNKSSSILAWAMNKIERGDLVRFTRTNYRNDGILIFDGKYFVSLDYERYDYGCIPIIFQVIKEFAVDYWKDVLPYSDEVVRYTRKLPFKYITKKIDKEVVLIILDEVTIQIYGKNKLIHTEIVKLLEEGYFCYSEYLSRDNIQNLLYYEL